MGVKRHKVKTFYPRQVFRCKGGNNIHYSRASYWPLAYKNYRDMKNNRVHFWSFLNEPETDDFFIWEPSNSNPTQFRRYVDVKLNHNKVLETIVKNIECFKQLALNFDIKLGQ